MLLHLLFLLLLLASQISLTRPLPIQLVSQQHHHSSSSTHDLLFPTTTSSSSIPAFPAESAASSSSSSCHLHLSVDLLAPISSACSPLIPSSRSQCCPSLAAALYSAYAASALSPPASGGNLPVLPDDSEACAGAAERAIIARGVELPRVNDTCGAAYCYCGIRLRRLSCGSAELLEGGVRRLEKDCARPGIAGCSLCLSTLNQLKGTAGNVSLKGVIPRDNDCQLMGLTWLLAKNRTRYLPTATAVLRAFMAAEGGAAVSGNEKVGPTCHQIHDEMPIAVGSSQIDDHSDTNLSAAGMSMPMLLLMTYSLFYVVFFLGS